MPSAVLSLQPPGNEDLGWASRVRLGLFFLEIPVLRAQCVLSVTPACPQNPRGSGGKNKDSVASRAHRLTDACDCTRPSLSPPHYCFKEELYSNSILPDSESTRHLRLYFAPTRSFPSPKTCDLRVHRTENITTPVTAPVPVPAPATCPIVHSLTPTPRFGLSEHPFSSHRLVPSSFLLPIFLIQREDITAKETTLEVVSYRRRSRSPSSLPPASPPAQPLVHSALRCASTPCPTSASTRRT